MEQNQNNQPGMDEDQAKAVKTLNNMIREETLRNMISEETLRNMTYEEKQALLDRSKKDMTNALEIIRQYGKGKKFKRTLEDFETQVKEHDSIIQRTEQFPGEKMTLNRENIEERFEHNEEYLDHIKALNEFAKFSMKFAKKYLQLISMATAEMWADQDRVQTHIAILLRPLLTLQGNRDIMVAEIRIEERRQFMGWLVLQLMPRRYFGLPDDNSMVEEQTCDDNSMIEEQT